LYVGMER